MPKWRLPSSRRTAVRGALPSDVPPCTQVAGETIGPHQEKSTFPVGAPVAALPVDVTPAVTGSPTLTASLWRIAPSEGMVSSDVAERKLIGTPTATPGAPTEIWQSGSGQSPLGTPE